MSKLASAPRWTPPMPPVAKTSMPASRAQIIVAATVVAPVQPSASATARSARESLRTSRAAARASSSRGLEADADAAVHDRDGRGDGAGGADLGLDGAGGLEVRRDSGMPWVMMVDSSATSGRRAAMASATSAEKASGGVMAPRG